MKNYFAIFLSFIIFVNCNKNQKENSEETSKKSAIEITSIQMDTTKSEAKKILQEARQDLVNQLSNINDLKKIAENNIKLLKFFLELKKRKSPSLNDITTILNLKPEEFKDNAELYYEYTEALTNIIENNNEKFAVAWVNNAHVSPVLKEELKYYPQDIINIKTRNNILKQFEDNTVALSESKISGDSFYSNFSATAYTLKWLDSKPGITVKEDIKLNVEDIVFKDLLDIHQNVLGKNFKATNMAALKLDFIGSPKSMEVFEKYKKIHEVKFEAFNAKANIEKINK